MHQKKVINAEKQYSIEKVNIIEKVKILEPFCDFECKVKRFKIAVWKK